MLPPTLHTERLLLRPHVVSDLPDLVRLAGEREIAATTRIPHPYSMRDAEKFISEWHDDSGGHVALAIVRQHDALLIGGTGLRIDPAHGHAELGYWIGVPYWGHGYATKPRGLW